MLLENAARLNGLTGLVITKLDVLTGLEALNICTGYDYNGENLKHFPTSLKVLTACKPVYETLPGWADDISGIRKYNDLPENAKSYLKRIEELEDIAGSFAGVEKCFAIQAGREVRVLVKPKEIDDLTAIRLARDISKKIEGSLTYPGQIKVVVARETVAVDYAK